MRAKRNTQKRVPFKKKKKKKKKKCRGAPDAIAKCLVYTMRMKERKKRRV